MILLEAAKTRTSESRHGEVQAAHSHFKGLSKSYALQTSGELAGMIMHVPLIRLSPGEVSSRTNQ